MSVSPVEGGKAGCVAALERSAGTHSASNSSISIRFQSLSVSMLPLLVIAVSRDQIATTWVKKYIEECY